MTSRCGTCGAIAFDATGCCIACGVQGAPAEFESVSIDSALRTGSVLDRGRYHVESVLGQGGFGITYRAFDSTLRRTVAIKEMFPVGSIRRGSTVVPPTQVAQTFQVAKAQFLQEAQNLARHRHRGIVQVFEVFEEANTAYLVMEFLDGPTYEDRLRAQGRLDSAEVMHMMRTIGDALGVLHRDQLLHRDVKPSNLLCVDGQPVLIDFGSARNFAVDGSVEMSRLISPGYSPLEQYAGQARFGPSSDVYALSATLYHLVTGVAPVDATDRVQGIVLPSAASIVPSIDPHLDAALSAGLEVPISSRPASFEALLAILNGTSSAPPITTQTEHTTRLVDDSGPISTNLVSPPAVTKNRSRRTPVFAGLGIFLLAGAVGAFALTSGNGTKVETVTAVPSAVESTVTPTTQPTSTAAPQLQVPDFSGASEASLSGEVQRVGLTAEITYDNSLNVAAGYAIRQTPAPGMMVDPGTSVRIVVSSGRPPVPVTAAPLTAAPRVENTARATPSASETSSTGETASEFVRRYYSLVNDGRYDESFPYMDSNYQSRAGGWDGYVSYWSGRTVSILGFDSCATFGRCRFRIRSNRSAGVKTLTLTLGLRNGQPIILR